MKVIYYFIIIVTVFSTLLYSEELSVEDQTDIIKNYMYITGHLSENDIALSESEHDWPVKCGTPSITTFLNNYDKFDQSLLKSLETQVNARPDFLTDTLGSPSGKFLLHYATSGSHAIYGGLPGGIPEYIDSTAAIFDAVYDHIVNTLGYPAPPTDGFYATGGDDRYDIYIYNIPGSVYGFTYPDSLFVGSPGTFEGTSYMEIENDFQEISPYRVTNDVYRPLDALRATAAHEFFHFVHFGIDFTESEQASIGGVNGPAWMEMSSTWMEEEIYDNVNDYYYYLPYFFDSPKSSIQQFSGGSDLHPYGSVVYPIFLSEKFGRDIIKEIWLRCGSYGSGPDFLEATGDVILLLSNDTENFNTTFSEFVTWNYFTGSRAALAPNNVGYSERNFYDEEYPDSTMLIVYTYLEDLYVLGGENPFNPPHNAAFYMKFDELRSLKYDTTYWNCNSGSFPTCTDSVGVVDTTFGYDVMHVDSILKVLLQLDENLKDIYDSSDYWGISVVYQLEDFLDSTEIDRIFILQQPLEWKVFEIPNPRQYRSITFIISPATSNYLNYNPFDDFLVSYWVSGEIFAVDSSLINRPASIFQPYPNPAVVSEMAEAFVKFKFNVPTDSSSFPTIGTLYSGSNPYLLVDLFNTAGEYICTLDEITESDSREGFYIVEWDLKNSSANDVASGVYIAYARFYSQKNDGLLLVESKTKVVVIR